MPPAQVRDQRLRPLRGLLLVMLPRLLSQSLLVRRSGRLFAW